MEFLYGEAILSNTMISLDFEMQSTFFISAILILAIALILKTKAVFLGELLILLSILVFEQLLEGITQTVLLSLQILFALFMIYRYKKAVDRNYLLVLEKTHQIPIQLTKEGNSGSQSSFL